jgi:ion channel-forming bestrophin family protein
MSDPEKNWFQLTVRIKSSVIPAIMPRVILCTTLGMVISLLENQGLPLPSEVFSYFIFPDLVLGLLLVFRTNTAYDRFWEGRKLWGTLVNTVRNFSRQIWLMVPEKEVNDTEHKIAILKLLVAFAVATKLHLRREKVNPEIEALTSPEQYTKLQTMNHPPLEIAFWIGDYLQDQNKKHHLHIYQLTALYKLLDTMVDVLGGCERISKTPLPLAYQIHLQQILLIYCLILPLKIVNNLGLFTALVVGIMTFTLLGIEEIARQIENPFGYDENDLQLDVICQAMLKNIQDLISLPPSVQNYDQEIKAKLNDIAVAQEVRTPTDSET